MAWIGQSLKDIRSAIRLLGTQDLSSYVVLLEDRHAFLVSLSLSRLAYSYWKVVDFFVCCYIALVGLVFGIMIYTLGFCIPPCRQLYKDLVYPDDPDDMHEWESPTAHKVAEWKKVWKHQCQEPLPLPPQKVDISRKKPLVQRDSALLTKLPLEVRLLVYKYALRYNAEHCHVLEVGPRVDKNYKSIPNRIYTMPCARPQDLKSQYPRLRCFDDHSDWIDTRTAIARPEGESSGLLRVCRQVYVENVEIPLVANQTFLFTNLTGPPYPLYAIPPHHLAQIRRIQLLVKPPPPSYRPCAPSSPSIFRRTHRMRQCPACNLLRWVHVINARMTGLARIDVIAVVEYRRVPELGEEEGWVRVLLSLLQQRQGAMEQGRRKVGVRVFGEWEGMRAVGPGFVGDGDVVRRVRRFVCELEVEMPRRREGV